MAWHKLALGVMLSAAANGQQANLEQILQQLNQLQRDNQRLNQEMLSTALQIRGLLNPSQLAKAADLHSQLKSTMAQMDSIIGGAPPMGPPVF